ncbi:2,3-diaminopropionate biosynthesis protein SbnA [Marinoscillum pacificum]|uniref:2,3-diaminopropionate biosynthesis protein SbnA n=1 Tax=Marinoscillum pacificum TaxID=392723 RepID=UPI00215717E3|nr:2,3-diaminopropionate biosynthesis protein SbnA [Marinoscillum pacificum]
MNHNTNTYNGILETIGHTPLVSLKNLYPEYAINAYAKLEMFNPGGSIKDRTAYNILQNAIYSGEIDDNTTIIESSSGNMAIGLAQICLKFGLRFIAVVDRNVNEQTVKILKTYGAEVNQVKDIYPHPSLLEARLARVQELLLSIPNSFWTNQYANRANPETHETTMNEIRTSLGTDLDYLLIATSTCGTLMGCADFISKYKLPTKIIAVDAVGSLIFQSKPGQRKIPGHGAGRKSQFLDMDKIHHVHHVNDLGCVNGCNKLLKSEAILAGGSSGALVTALGAIADQIPEGSNCVMIFSDRGERYLDTIYSPEWVEMNFKEYNMALAG